MFVTAATAAAVVEPSLSGCITMQNAFDDGLLEGPRAAAARAQLGISKAGYSRALTFPNPGLDMDYGWRAEHTYRTGVSLNIEGPWKVVFRLLATKQEVNQSMLQIRQTLWNLRADIRRMYTTLVVAEESRRIYHELAELTNELFQAAQTRFDNGDVPKSDVYRAKLAFLQAGIDSDQSDRQVIQAREQLNIIRGHFEDEAIDVPKLHTFTLYAQQTNLLPDLSVPMKPLAAMLAEAMTYRPEIRLARQQVVTEQAHLRTNFGNVLPNPNFGFGKSVVTDPGQGPTVVGTYMTSHIEFPIFNFQQGPIATSRATIKQLKYQVGAQENIVRGQVALAYRKVWNAREKIRRYQDEVLAASEKVAELARVSYRLGQTDITAAVTAQQANIQVRQQYLNTIIEYQQAFTDYEQSVGHPLE